MSQRAYSAAAKPQGPESKKTETAAQMAVANRSERVAQAIAARNTDSARAEALRAELLRGAPPYLRATIQNASLVELERRLVARDEHRARQAEEHASKEAQRAAEEREIERIETLALELYGAAAMKPHTDDFSSLTELRDAALILHRGDETEASRALSWLSTVSIFEENCFDTAAVAFARNWEPAYESRARRWFIVRDTRARLLQHVTDRKGFVRAWRDSIAELRGVPMLVKAAMGEHIEAVLWSDQPLEAADVRKWCRGVQDGDRFEPVSYPWCMPYDDEMVDLASAEQPIHFRSAPKPAEASTGGLRTGIEALDAQFRGAPRVPTGARVCISGPPENSKTLVALELAESFAAQGAFVVWLALDEQADRITARRLQRRGVSAGHAQAPTPGDLARLEGVDLFVVEPTEPFEELWAQAAAEASDQPIVFVVDSIQKLRTCAGDGRGERERIDAALNAIQACQRKHAGTVVFTSEITRKAGDAKGSVGLDYAATLHLAVKLSDGSLTLRILKSRDGSKAPLKLAVDLDAQRLFDPAAKAAADAEGRAWSAVSGGLQGGPLSARALVESLKGQLSRAALRRWLVTWVDAGRLELVDGHGYRLSLTTEGVRGARTSRARLRAPFRA